MAENGILSQFSASDVAKFNKELSQIIDREMKRKKFANRSEFFRDLIRKSYLTWEPYKIEELGASEPDMALLRSRKKNASFVNIKDLLR